MKIIQTTKVFDNWFENLRDNQAKAKIRARIQRAKLGNLGDCEPVGSGVSEMRIHYGAGYRIYFIQQGSEMIVLLAGGDKSTQSKDIKLALQIAEDIKRG